MPVAGWVALGRGRAAPARQAPGWPWPPTTTRTNSWRATTRRATATRAFARRLSPARTRPPGPTSASASPARGCSPGASSPGLPAAHPAEPHASLGVGVGPQGAYGVRLGELLSVRASPPHLAALAGWRSGAGACALQLRHRPGRGTLLLRHRRRLRQRARTACPRPTAGNGLCYPAGRLRAGDCNGKDDDCDGVVDDHHPCGAGAPASMPGCVDCTACAEPACAGRFLRGGWRPSAVCPSDASCPTADWSTPAPAQPLTSATCPEAVPAVTGGRCPDGESPWPGRGRQAAQSRGDGRAQCASRVAKLQRRSCSQLRVRHHGRHAGRRQCRAGGDSPRRRRRTPKRRWRGRSPPGQSLPGGRPS